MSLSSSINGIVLWNGKETKSSCMRQVLLIPFVCLAILIAVIAIRPSTAESLARDFPSQSETIALLMPKAGTKVQLPNLDIHGGTILNSDSTAVVAMPSCQSCTIRRINWEAIQSLSKEPIVLVFPEVPSRDYPHITSSKFRVIIEGSHPILPPKLHDFGPNCLWLDKTGKVIRTMEVIPLKDPSQRTQS